MKPFKKTHMDREDRIKTEVQLGNAELCLRRAELGISYAKEQVSSYKVTEQQQRAFEEAERLLRQSSDSSKTSLSQRSSSSKLTVTNPAPLEQPIRNIIQAKEEIGPNLYRAKVHREAANFLLKDKLTPTALVRDYNKRNNEIGTIHADLTKEDQQIDNFLSSHCHPHYRLTGGKQEKE